MEVRKTLLVPYPPEFVFDLIEQAEHYPEFLPWCGGATILSRTDDVVSATLRVDYRGVRFQFTTRNPKHRPDWLNVELADGPFRRFEGGWKLVRLADVGCRIEFTLRHEFSSTVMQKLAGPVFDRIADTLVDALVAHADRVWAQRGPQAIASAPDAAAAPSGTPGGALPTAPAGAMAAVVAPVAPVVAPVAPAVATVAPAAPLVPVAPAPAPAAVSIAACEATSGAPPIRAEPTAAALPARAESTAPAASAADASPETPEGAPPHD